MDYALIKVITLCNLQLFTALLFLYYVMISKKYTFLFLFIFFFFFFWRMPEEVFYFHVLQMKQGELHLEFALTPITNSSK